MLKILIADDHPIVRKGLKEILVESKDIIIVDEASNGQEVLDRAWKNDYDVVVLDIAMPGRSGLDVLKQLKKENYSSPVLILSRYPEDQYAVRVLKLGADGFLTKECTPEELIGAIKKVANGGKYISSALAEKLAVYIKNDSEKKPHEKLSNREFEVMLMLSSGKTVGEISEDLSLSVNTISTYRLRILEKMEMNNNSQLMRYALNEKLID